MPTSTVGYIVAALAGVVLGLALGAIVVLVAVVRLTPLLVRAGRGEALAGGAESTDALPTRGDPEAMAHQRLMHDAIERGAQQLIAEAAAGGMALSLEAARRDAAAMLGQSMPDPRGGVR